MRSYKDHESLVIFILSMFVVAIPLFSSELLYSLDDIFMRIILLTSLIFTAYYIPLASLILLLVVGLLFIERNRRKITNSRNRHSVMKKEKEIFVDDGKKKEVHTVSSPFQEYELESWFVPKNDIEEGLGF